MVEVEIKAPRAGGPDEPGRWETIATLRVDGQQLEFVGDRQVVDLNLPVPDRRRRMRDGPPTRQLRFDEDREEWARNLPAVYRGPKLLAVVVQDSSPLRSKRARWRQPVSVPDPERA